MSTRPAAPADEPATSSPAGWLIVALVTACAVLAGLLELLLVPLYAGAVLIPVAVVFAVATNIALPRLALAAVRSALAAVAPFVGWLAVAIFLGVVPRSEGDYIAQATGYVKYVYYGVLLGGALAGTVTVVIGAPPAKASQGTGAPGKAGPARTRPQA